jgi:hypothetical protein
LHFCCFRRAEKLKEKVQNSRDLLNDNEAWACQQQLQVSTVRVLINCEFLFSYFKVRTLLVSFIYNIFFFATEDLPAGPYS